MLCPAFLSHDECYYKPTSTIQVAVESPVNCYKYIVVNGVGQNFAKIYTNSKRHMFGC